MSRAAVVAAVALLCLVGSCAGRQGRGYTRPTRITGTCPGACRHYVSCKDSERSGLYGACVTECRQIFVEDGKADRVTLGEFEKLQCPDAVGFVEGSSGRGPGVTPTSSSEASR